MKKEAVKAALIAYRDRIPRKKRTEFVTAGEGAKEANDLLSKDPFAFLLGVVFDQGQRAERAWRAPYPG